MTKGKLLIVDDENEIRDMLARHFRILGYTTNKAKNGKNALEILSENKVDVVISDIMMPVMDGVTLLGEIKKQYPMTRVIMTTGYVTLENALACMRRQADTVVFKPFNDLHELEKAVNQAIEHLENWKRKLRELHGMKPTSKKLENSNEKDVA